MIIIDLNADLGEGEAHDAQMFALVTSANIACGVHAGDAMTMRQSLVLAKQHGVAAGAHPGFADRQNKGRVMGKATPTQVHELVTQQVQALGALAAREGVRLCHVKAHGALYNQAAQDEELAHALVAAVAAIDRGLLLYGLPGSCLDVQARAVGLRFIGEAFVDRAYDERGLLVPRQQAGAVLVDAPAALADRALKLAVGLPIPSLSGSPICVAAQTLCVHGDTPAAVAVTTAVRAHLGKHGIVLRAPS